MLKWNQFRVFCVAEFGKDARRFGIDQIRLFALRLAEIDIRERCGVNQQIEIYRVELRAHESNGGSNVNSKAMKRPLLYFVVTLCTAGLVHADQAIRSLQQTLKQQRFLLRHGYGREKRYRLCGSAHSFYNASD